MYVVLCRTVVVVVVVVVFAGRVWYWNRQIPDTLGVVLGLWPAISNRPAAARTNRLERASNNWHRMMILERASNRHRMILERSSNKHRMMILGRASNRHRMMILERILSGQHVTCLSKDRVSCKGDTVNNTCTSFLSFFQNIQSVHGALLTLSQAELLNGYYALLFSKEKVLL